ncbi:uncharacterized protein G2W53_008488 [Senna tora]|uniref:Uncharacterized protein n=1 Tax=Senna tora TaxID=362788 RepID=A0A834X7X9_9FABA|nr:uncharacterized protein G2W53_008488 [Senna tora]
MDSVMAAPRTEQSMKMKTPKKNGGGGTYSYLANLKHVKTR